MRYIILMLLIATTIHGQSTTQTATNQSSFQPMLINAPITSSTPDGKWRNEIVGDGKHINLMYHELVEDGWSASVWNIIEPNPWETHLGWFVFVESESRVWAYDGDRELILQVETPNKKATYSGRFPYAIPKEVFSRLSKEAQKDIQKAK